MHVWGSGFLSPQNTIKMRLHKIWQFFRGKYGNPTIHAVRGEKTADILRNVGISCPNVYGDPALLMPLLYKKKVEKTHRLGVVLHWKHDSFEEMFFSIDSVKIIRINRHINEIEQFIDEINECEAVLSSSLHGLIIANAYKVPCVRLKMSDMSIHNKMERENFKFDDYLSGLNYGVANDSLKYSFSEYTMDTKGKMNQKLVEDILKIANVPEFEFNHQLLLESFPLPINKSIVL